MHNLWPLSTLLGNNQAAPYSCVDPLNRFEGRYCHTSWPGWCLARPTRGLLWYDLCRGWAVVYGWKCNAFSRIFNIVSAILVAEWMSGGKKSILARVVFGTKWGFVHN